MTGLESNDSGVSGDVSGQKFELANTVRQSERMKRLNPRMTAIAIAGVGVLTVVGAIVYWQQQRQGCMQVNSGGQEVTYSRGCLNPQRYKKWGITT